jgi:hypothetical protein
VGVPVVPTPTPVVAPVAGGVKLVVGGVAVVVGATGVVVVGIAVDVGGVKVVAGGTNAVGGVTTPPPPIVVPTALPVVPVVTGIEVFVPVPVEVPVAVVLLDPELTVLPVVPAGALGFAPELEPLTPQPERTIHASRNNAAAEVHHINHLGLMGKKDANGEYRVALIGTQMREQPAAQMHRDIYARSTVLVKA